MRQWKTLAGNEYIIENRRKEDICREIGKLAKSYTPEWLFDEKNPDIGSVIALLFADGMEENLRRYNTLPERDYVELMNMLGISLKAAYPSHSIVLLSLVPNTIPGFRLKKGSKLLSGTEDNEQIIFETAQTVYITESKISSAFMVSGKNGKVIPIAGQFAPLEYVEEKQTQEEPVSGTGEDGHEQPSFTLFDFQKSGYGLYGLMMYHEHLFDTQDNEIRMRIEGSPELVSDIAGGRYRLAYYGEEGFTEVEKPVWQTPEIISFHKSGQCKKVKKDGKEYSLLLLEPKEIPEKNVTVSAIQFASIGEKRQPDILWNGTTELEKDRFLPFGETISLYSELYIGSEEYFSKPGAEMSIQFALDFETHMVSIPRQQEEKELKVIKRKPVKDVIGAPAEVYADEISFEYFNGIGWRKLTTVHPVRQIFGNGQRRNCTINFICPEDMRPMDIGGYHGCCIRIQITRSDNCFFQPSLHHYPVISDMTVAYSYEEHYEKPDKLYSYQGSSKKDLTLCMQEKQPFRVFQNHVYQDGALYLGFDKKIEEGPVSLYIQIQDRENQSSGKLTFSYATRDGFSRLKLTDHTDGLRHTGTLLFMPPTDMAKRRFEGQEAYWIRIVDEQGELEDAPLKRPVISDMRLNAVEVDNVDTMAEDAYYIDAFGPNMQFALNAQNVLSLDVWVNEMGLYSEAQMRSMLAERPEETRAEYSFLGEIEEFYVLWKEVDNFDRSKPGDRHYMVDRMNSRIQFGDGVHVQIPRNTRGIAFKVVLRRCDGERANLKAGKISDSLGGLLFVDEIRNPMQSYGGMNMETLKEALQRGTTVISSHNRLVSAQDYEREVLSFSNRIVQAKVITDQRKDGSRRPGAFSIVILMQDYKDGDNSFLHMEKRLRKHLLTKCEMTVTEQSLELVTPLFVEISVEAWVRLLKNDDSFEVQQQLLRILEEYLDPILNTGWKIGRMVQKEQIKLRLGMEKGKVMFQRMMITARYRDENGWHETDLKKLYGNPYVLVTSGKHKIHFE